LLMHKIHQQYPEGIQYLKSEKVIVQTPVQASWSEFLNQRIRWSSKADQYPEKRLTLILAVVYLFNFWFLVLLIAGIFHTSYLKLGLFLLLVKIVAELIFLIP